MYNLVLLAVIMGKFVLALPFFAPVCVCVFCFSFCICYFWGKEGCIFVCIRIVPSLEYLFGSSLLSKETLIQINYTDVSEHHNVTLLS